ncbi:auxin efflux carrier superfamily [Niveomyces insectorum RCEF 264]|uniref:Auxin efflux carrier superfamily n=1 Tax=Niveomyces insectorum RCEF 264 TaxID=1081102 RepID=A0A167ULK3_9HYPO|nr:auxin efflux carrier superfamily [Niveomyces insectorum RCEF 264]
MAAAAAASELVSGGMALAAMQGHDSHPSFGHLVMLVFEAVMEVVCVSLPGYIIARLGHFDADKQKFLANLNVMLFTPCLIFTKLASQLDPNKFIELAIIPIIFVIMTLVSYLVSVGVARLLHFNKRASNFVTAMGVFGNSNSLPISLVLSLSQTLKGLHWDRIPGDNDDEVAARGILYLMIFQQLGQVVRWSWGYHILLAPKHKYKEYQQAAVEEGRYRDDPDGDNDDADADYGNDAVNTEAIRHHSRSTSQHTLFVPDGFDMETNSDDDDDDDDDGGGGGGGEEDNDVKNGSVHTAQSPTTTFSDVFEPSGRTPVAPRSRGSPADSDVEDGNSSGGGGGSQGQRTPSKKSLRSTTTTPKQHIQIVQPNGFFGVGNDGGDDDDNDDDGRYYANGDGTIHGGILSFPRIRNINEPDIPPGLAGVPVRVRLYRARSRRWLAATQKCMLARLPPPAQTALAALERFVARVCAGVAAFMNPPLWAMLAAIVVASVPRLQRLFFAEGSFVQNSVTSAVTQTAGVAVPLILVVLGANLARNTQPGHSPHEQHGLDPEEAAIGTRLLVASLVCRMLLPTLVMAPILALFAKYVPISILDDPIFVIVCFLLTGAPSALQLAQICQINGVFEQTMSKILFQSYVIWILPSTLILVLCALEVVEWAKY